MSLSLQEVDTLFIPRALPSTVPAPCLRAFGHPGLSQRSSGALGPDGWLALLTQFGYQPSWTPTRAPSPAEKQTKGECHLNRLLPTDCGTSFSPKGFRAPAQIRDPRSSDPSLPCLGRKKWRSMGPLPPGKHAGAHLYPEPGTSQSWACGALPPPRACLPGSPWVSAALCKLAPKLPQVRTRLSPTSP